MRIWSIHPKYLDAKGLVALWRETLLAKNVLKGNTKGYKNHPQLNRFKETKHPLDAINFYLECIYQEALNRGYNFDSSKFIKIPIHYNIPVTEGQLEFELNHLKVKLKNRDFNKFLELKQLSKLETHPIFKVIPGTIESWEIT